VAVPDLVDRRACGVTWRVSARDLDAIAPWLDALGELDSEPGVQEIKRSRYRTVRRLRRAGAPGYILKEYRIPSLRDRLKERWLRSAARTEWSALLRLARLGVSVSRAVAFGRPVDTGREVAAYSILEEIPDVLSVKRHYRTLGPSLDRQCAFTTALGGFVRSFHDIGVTHNDLHAGNILVRTRPTSAEAPFVLIDLQRARIGRVPGARRRAGDLAMLMQAFRGAGRDRIAVRRALLSGYVDGPPRIESRHLSLHSIDKRIARLRERRAASRGRRCLVNSSQYAVERTREARVYHRRDYAFDEVLALAQPDTSPPAQDDVRLCTGHDGVALEVTAYPASVRLFRRSRALEGYVAAHRRHVDDTSLPRPVAAVDVLRGRRKGTSVLIVEWAGESGDHGWSDLATETVSAIIPRS
jgi:tRNA A-37 threonylcarbamoyl transferase component Bud32